MIFNLQEKASNDFTLSGIQMVAFRDLIKSRIWAEQKTLSPRTVLPSRFIFRDKSMNFGGLARDTSIAWLPNILLSAPLPELVINTSYRSAGANRATGLQKTISTKWRWRLSVDLSPVVPLTSLLVTMARLFLLALLWDCNVDGQMTLT